MNKEVWKDTKNSGLVISSKGRVGIIGGISKPIEIVEPILLGGNTKNKKGGKYPCIKYNKKINFIHTLVLEAFVSLRPIGMVACHNNGNPIDNRVENLRWDTQANNNKDKILHGTSTRLTNEMLDKLYWEVYQGKTVNQVSKEYGFCRGWTYTAKKREKAGTYFMPPYARKDYRENKPKQPLDI